MRGFLQRNESAIWNDRATKVMPCRCSCGREVRVTGDAPKTAFYSEGCKARYAQAKADAKALKHLVTIYAPIYDHCPRLVWLLVVQYMHLIQVRKEKKGK